MYAEYHKRSRQSVLTAVIGALIASAVLANCLEAQSRPGNPQTTQPTRPASGGPSMDETRAWIEGEMRALLATTDSRRSTDRYGTTSWLKRITARNTQFQACTLKFVHEIVSHTFYDTGRETRNYTSDDAVPMRDLEVGAIAIQEPWKLSHEEWVDQPIEIALRTRAAVGATIITRSHQGLGGGGGLPRRAPYEAFREGIATLPAQDRASADRIIRALKRAAELCGAARPTF